MVRSASSEGGENGGGQNGVPGEVNEGTIKSFQSWSASSVRPSVHPIEQRELNEAKIVDAIIEGFSFRPSKVTVVFLMSISDHVEVSIDQPGKIFRRGDAFELI
jgi:hypothetical protein